MSEDELLGDVLPATPVMPWAATSCTRSQRLLHLYIGLATWSSPATIYVGLDLRRVDLYDACDELRNAETGKAMALDGPDEGTRRLRP